MTETSRREARWSRFLALAAALVLGVSAFSQVFAWIVFRDHEEEAILSDFVGGVLLFEFWVAPWVTLAAFVLLVASLCVAGKWTRR